jgi:hypothetical protein
MRMLMTATGGCGEATWNGRSDSFLSASAEILQTEVITAEVREMIKRAVERFEGGEPER